MVIDYAFRFLDKIYFNIGKNNFCLRKKVEKLGDFFSAPDKRMVFYRLNKIDFI